MVQNKLQEFTRFDFAHDGKRYPVYVIGNEGPGILIMHELPGMMPETLEFARRLRKSGFRVYLPLFFGTPGKPFSGPATAAYSIRLCISKEFYLFKHDKTSPIVEWLRALCRRIHADCGGPGVGAIGMCLTGGFAIPLLVEPALLAPVLSQPSLPADTFARGAKKLDCHRALGCSPGDLAVAKERVRKEGLTIQGYKFSEDKLSPNPRFDRLREEFGEGFTPMVIDSSPGNPHLYPRSHHAVFTVHYSDEPGTPTRQAYDKLIKFFDDKLN
jgi:dienelactone hydrolase